MSVNQTRINRMYQGDCAWALVALLALWITIAFVFYKVALGTADFNVVLALGAGASVLLVFNTAAIVALLRHYTTDKAHLYGLDLFYIDEMRAARKGRQHDAR